MYQYEVGGKGTLAGTIQPPSRNERETSIFVEIRSAILFAEYLQTSGSAP